MQFLRKVGVAAAATLLTFALLGFGFAWSSHQVFGTATGLKQVFVKSGVYQSIVADVLHQQTNTSPNTAIPVDQPQVKQIIENAFPPQFLQSQTEQVIDALYTWLNGKSPSLQFAVDLSTAKRKLADGVEQYTIAHLATLPSCPANEIPSGDIDPFSAACVPGGIDRRAIAAKERETIVNGSFLKNSTISASTLKNSDGKTLSQQLQKAPAVYRRAKLGLYISALLALTLAAIVVFASATWRQGLRKVSTILVIVGAVSASLGWASSVAVHRASSKIASLQATDKALQQQVLNVVQVFTDTLRTRWVTYGVVLIVLGIITLATLRLTASRQAKGIVTPQDKVNDESVNAKTDPPQNI